MNKLSIKRRLLRIRKKIKSVNKDRFRLSVYKSSKNISAQIIDDQSNKTLVAASSLEKNIFNKMDKIDKSKISTIVGEILAKRANEKKINKVFFDRGKNKYHGRVKALANAARKSGLKFWILNFLKYCKSGKHVWWYSKN